MQPKTKMKKRANNIAVVVAVFASQIALGQTVNKITSTDFLKSGATTATNPSSWNHNEYRQQINYLDGLGRPIQSVQVGGAGSSSEDLIIPMEYDNYGRSLRQYLPYTDTRSGAYRSTALSDQLTFYTTDPNDVVNDNNPYSYSVIEKSARARTEEQWSPGSAWQTAGKKVSYVYGYNTGSEVKLWEYNAATKEASTQGFYSANQLHKQTVFDEDGNETATYTDKTGKTILKKTLNGSQWVETHYVYDEFDRLILVLPPQIGSFTIVSGNYTFSSGDAGQVFAYDLNSTVTVPDGVILTTGSHIRPLETLTDAVLDDWAFRYEYDGEGRMISKQVPGSDPVQMVYDKWDRLVLTQDGVQQGTKWIFTAYDELNRPAITGFVNDTRDRGAMQTYISGLAERYITHNGTGTHGYNNGAYPFNNIGSGTLGDILTVTYYDGDGSGSTLSQTNYSRPTELNSSGTFLILPSAQSNVRGLVSGSKTRKLGTSDFIETKSIYDDRYRTIQVISENTVGGNDILSNQYDFSGGVRKSLTVHNEGRESN